ncbi:MAG: Abi-alpha family protein [Haemophilus parainfluenzae]|nr:Abi-alpha family protein [Haemophilus parainfluenzae]
MSTEDIERGLNLIKADTPKNIQAMLDSDNPDLNEAGKIEARLRRKDAENKEKIRNFIPSIINKIKDGKALKNISDNFNDLPESRKNSIANRSLRLAECDKHIEISSIPAFADSVERLHYLEDEPNLAELFEELLISIIDSSKKYINHPAYVEVLKQISNQEAHNLKLIFSHSPNSIAICNFGFKHHNGGTITLLKYCLPIPFSEIPAQALENWERLKLIEIVIDLEWITDDSSYKYAQDILAALEKENASYAEHLEIRKGVLRFTEFGKNFAKAVGIIK